MIRSLIEAACRRHGLEGYIGAALALVGQMKNKELLQVEDLRQLEKWVPLVDVALAKGLSRRALAVGGEPVSPGAAQRRVANGFVSGPAGIRAIKDGLADLDKQARTIKQLGLLS